MTTLSTINAPISRTIKFYNFRPLSSKLNKNNQVKKNMTQRKHGSLIFIVARLSQNPLKRGKVEKHKSFSFY